MATTVISNSTVTTAALPATADGDSVTLINSSVSGFQYAPGAGNDSISLDASTLGTFLYSAGAGDDTLVATSSSLAGSYSLQDGNDRVTLDSVTVALAQTFNTGIGDDQLSLNAVTNLTNVTLDAGNDSLTLSNLQMANSGNVDAGAGSDSIVIQGATLPAQSLFLGNSTANDAETLVVEDSSLTTGRVSSTGNGTFSVTIDNSTLGGAATAINNTGALFLTNSDGGSLQITNASSVTGAVNTGNGDDIINVDGASNVSGNIGDAGGNDTISISGGSTGSRITLGAGNDSVHISDSTLTFGIIDNQTGANTADTILIENSSIGTGTASGGVSVSGIGNQVSILNSQMGDTNLMFSGVGNSTVVIENTSLGQVDDLADHQVSLAITGSTVDQGVALGSGTTSNQSIDIRGSSVGLAGGSGTDFGILTTGGNDQVTVAGGSTLAVNSTAFGNGQDLFVLGTDTSLIAPTGSDNISGGFETTGGGAGFAGDTLRLFGNGPYSITLSGTTRATLNDNSTVSIITNENYGNIQSFPAQIDGTLSLGDTSTTVGINEFEALEAIPCFVDGTVVTTARGEVRVENLRAGDMVQTADAGLQPIRWAGMRRITALDQMLNPDLTPILIKQGALGHGLPHRDLLVSPQHRMLVTGKLVERMFGVEEALVAAKHLLAIDGIERATGLAEFTYVHFMFNDHQIVYAEGAASESLFVGQIALQTLADEARKEIELIFPELAKPVSDYAMMPARYFANGRQARKLAERAIKNNIALLEKEQSGLHALVS